MRTYKAESWFVLGLIVASAVSVGSCTSNAISGGGGGASPTPLVGCNAGASNVAIASEALTLVHRMPDRGPHPAYIQGKIAVKFTATGAEPEVSQAMARMRAVQMQPPGPSSYAIYNIPEGISPVAAAASLAGTRGIAEATPLMARYLQDTIPNDTDFGPPPPYVGPHTTTVQWDMYYIKMPTTWDTWKGSAGVTIAIIDTGYDANNIDVCSKVVNSAVFDLGGGAQDIANSVQDKDGHGTNVSGIAASVTDNATRFAGVGWNTNLLEVRVFQTPSPTNPTPGASNLDIAAGINWAVTHGAKVINLSLGGAGPCDTAEQNAINAANGAGVVVVVASGNEAAGSLDAPADCHGTISVGASAIDDVTTPLTPTEIVASYSNWGSNGDGLTVVAPGGDPKGPQKTCGTVPACDYLQWIINNYSTTATTCCGNPGPAHGILIAGTSQATPHVSGIAAIMLAKSPGTSPALIKQLLELYADDIGGGVKQGAGRVNAFRTLSHS